MEDLIKKIEALESEVKKLQQKVEFIDMSNDSNLQVVGSNPGIKRSGRVIGSTFVQVAPGQGDILFIIKRDDGPVSIVSASLVKFLD